MKIDMLGNKVLIVGLGKSGKATAELAQNHGAQVWGYDDKETRGRDLPAGRQGREASEFKNIPLVSKFEVRSSKFDLVITSPGIPFDHGILKLAAQKKWPVASEVEFAFNLLNPAFVIGITGTNGKTTVVELLNHIYKLSGQPFTVAGNIGTPLSSLRSIEGPLILELSSFQLHFINKFRANIGVILNVTEDHLDWHCCFGQYLKDKFRIFENQKPGDIALINSDDPNLSRGPVASGLPPVRERSLHPSGALPPRHPSASVLSFSIQNTADYCLKDGYLTARGEKIMPVEQLKIKGHHNFCNALAALACAKEAGLPVDTITEGLKSFEGLKHRLQFVTEVGGISFYNDSKSTNPDSTSKAIESFNHPLILLMGGRNKGNDFSYLKKYLGKQIKELILFGEAASDIKEQISGGLLSKDVSEALKKALNKAQSGDAVVFSPGCSSFDQYDDYAQRGDDFIRLVKELNG